MPTTALTTALALIRQWEGCSLTPIPDTPPRWQIGWGMNWLPDGSPVQRETPAITQEAADAWLALKGRHIETAVRALAPANATENQIAACIDFCWNEGEGAFAGSRLLSAWRTRAFPQARAQFGRWVYAGGKIDSGLIHRRAAEAQLFLPEQK